MKFYFLDEKINSAQVAELIEFIHKYPEEPKTIYMRSEGGEVDCAILITKILNQYKDSITLIAGEWLESCAVDVFHDFQGAKEFNELGTLIMIHRTAYTNSSLSKTRPIMDTYSKRADTASLNKYRELLTKKDIKTFNEGGEVYFDSEKVKNFFIK